MSEVKRLFESLVDPVERVERVSRRIQRVEMLGSEFERERIIQLLEGLRGSYLSTDELIAVIKGESE